MTDVIAWLSPQSDTPSESQWRALSDAEHAHAETLGGGRQRDFVSGRALLRQLLLEHAPMDADNLFPAGAYDAPLLSGIRVSLSHSHGHTLAAIHLNGRIGVDLEGIDRSLDPLRLSRRFFSPAEADAYAELPSDLLHERFVQCWTLKEAWLKAEGRGIANGLDALAVDPRNMHIAAPGSYGYALADVGSLRVALVRERAPHRQPKTELWWHDDVLDIHQSLSASLKWLN